MSGKYAVCIDGAFLIKKLQNRHKKFPKIEDIESELDRIRRNAALSDYRLLRIYFYDAPPATDVLTNPIDGTKQNLANTRTYKSQASLHQQLEMMSDVSLRMGDYTVHGWTLGQSARRALQETPRTPTAKDFVPHIEQKGVDLRIGLDMARLALREMVDVIVVVTGDSDLIPAFKFVRREGVRLYLDYLGHGVRRELKVHTDLIL